MTWQSGSRCIAGAAMLALVGCSSVQPDEGVPPAPAGLDYPSVGERPAPAGGAMLSPAERQKLETDLDRYKLQPE